MSHKPIPDGITSAHVRSAISLLDQGTQHSFGKPTRWALMHEGRQYPPKAVIGIAAQFALGKRLEPGEFSSGEGRRQAVGYLRGLGFSVVPIDTV